MPEKAPKSAVKVPFEGNAVPSPSSRRQLAGQQQQEIARMFGFSAPRARAKMLLFFLTSFIYVLWQSYPQAFKP